MTARPLRRRTRAAIGALALCVLAAGHAAHTAGAAAQRGFDQYERDQLRKRERDRIFRALGDGVMRLRKTSYASIADGLDIPIYVFEPLELRGERGIRRWCGSTAACTATSIRSTSRSSRRRWSAATSCSRRNTAAARATAAPTRRRSTTAGTKSRTA